MNEKLHAFKNSVSKATAISADTLFAEPTIVLHGYQELSIDQHQSILSYCEENIKVSLKSGMLSVAGSALAIKQLCKDRLTIIGKIQSIEIEELA